MDFHPILEADDLPKPSMWYVLSARGEAPSMRVGHTCIFVPANMGNNNVKGQLLIIGGANPSGSFGETHMLDFDKYEWDTVEWSGLQPRCEHTAWRASDNSLCLFGGAEMAGNLNNVQQLNFDSGIWTSPEVSGTPPSPRTCHSHGTAANMMYVFGGGQSGTEPVADRQLHIFDSNTFTWSQPKTNGHPPKARHGHVMVVMGSRMFLHGGMSGGKLYDDVHALQLKTMTWKQLRCKGDIPSARAAHSAVVSGNKFIISGGMSHNGAMDDVYIFNTDTLYWTKLSIEGPAPACRLVHSMCLIKWHYKVNKEGTILEHSITNQVESAAKGTLDGAIQELVINEQSNNIIQDEISSVTTVIKTQLDVAKLDVDESSVVEGASGEAVAIIADSVAAEKTSVSETIGIDARTIDNTVGAAGGDSNSDGDDAGKLSTREVGCCTLLLMFGGMDTHGEIFNDTLVMRLDLPT